MKKIIIGIVLLASVASSVGYYLHTHTPLYKCMHSGQADSFRSNPVVGQLAGLTGMTVEQLLEKVCQEVIITQPGVF